MFNNESSVLLDGRFLTPRTVIGAAILFVAFAAPLLAAPSVTPHPPARSRPDLQWSMPAKDFAGTRFSELDAITDANAPSLRLAWSFAVATEQEAGAAPLVVGTTMYVATADPCILYALDLNRASGNNPVKWIYEPDPTQDSEGATCLGVCFADGKVFMNTPDGHTIAVDAAMGAEIWKTQVADIQVGEMLRMAPLVVAGKVLVGNNAGEAGVRGWLKALDATSGALRWTAYGPGPTASGKFWVSYDPGLHVIYYGNASRALRNPELDSGENAWTCNIFARDPETGEARWSYQKPSSDAFLGDGFNENILIDLAMSRHTRRVLLHPERDGYIYVLDRTTGEVVSATAFVPATSKKEVDPTGATTTLQPAAYSPRTGLLYIPHHTLTRSREMTEANSSEPPFLAANASMFPASTKSANRGRFIAWDPLARKAAWMLEERSTVGSGALATAGDVVFYGTTDGQMKAVNARTGKALWTFNTKRPVVGQPITYLGPDGKQYVAVLAAGETDAGEKAGRLLVFSLP